MGEPLKPATVFECLSDEARARMTLLTALEGVLCSCDLTTALDEKSQPKIFRYRSFWTTRPQGVGHQLHPHHLDGEV